MLKVFEDFPRIYEALIQKLLEEFTGSVNEFRALFQIPKKGNTNANIVQQIYQTAKHKRTQHECFRVRKQHKLSSLFMTAITIPMPQPQHNEPPTALQMEVR